MAFTQPAARRTSPSLADVVGRLLGEGRQLVADYAELTVLDARRAAIRLAWILGCVLVAAVLNIVAAGALAWFTLTLAKELPFTALLRQLRGCEPEPPQ